jgi:hypothetical protein
MSMWRAEIERLERCIRSAGATADDIAALNALYRRASLPNMHVQRVLDALELDTSFFLESAGAFQVGSNEPGESWRAVDASQFIDLAVFSAPYRPLYFAYHAEAQDRGGVTARLDPRYRRMLSASVRPRDPVRRPIVMYESYADDLEASEPKLIRRLGALVIPTSMLPSQVRSSVATRDRARSWESAYWTNPEAQCRQLVDDKEPSWRPYPHMSDPQGIAKPRPVGSVLYVFPPVEYATSKNEPHVETCVIERELPQRFPSPYRLLVTEKSDILRAARFKADAYYDFLRMALRTHQAFTPIVTGFPGLTVDPTRHLYALIEYNDVVLPKQLNILRAATHAYARHAASLSSRLIDVSAGLWVEERNGVEAHLLPSWKTTKRVLEHGGKHDIGRLRLWQPVLPMAYLQRMVRSDVSPSRPSLPFELPSDGELKELLWPSGWGMVAERDLRRLLGGDI